MQGNDPVYVWVPLRAPPSRRFPKTLLVNADAKQYMGPSSLGPANLQVIAHSSGFNASGRLLA